MKITCRICQIQQGEFFTLDSIVPVHSQSKHKLLDLYNKCFNLYASLQDSLPQVVCTGCSEKLKEYFQFQLKAEKSDLELREIVPDVGAHSVKTEFLSQLYRQRIAVSNEGIIKQEFDDMGETVLEDTDNYERINDDNEENEDTDILFELYNKHDSCMEKYLKPQANDFEAIVEKDNLHKECNTKNINLPENYTPSDSKSSNEITTLESIIKPIEISGIESVIPSIEISRIELPMQCEQVPAILLEPLIEERKWQCLECGRKYSTELKLAQHRNLHIELKDCLCKICGSHLKSLYECKEHMKTHSTERKIACEFCDKTFATRANLKAHISIHINLRPFKCEICGKAFHQKSILKTHMTLHTGKPFECTLCNRRFSRTAHLNIHMRQHNNIRPYQCDQCPSSYMQKSHLDRHISSSHLGVRFQCSVCSKMYTKKPSLYAHIREAHSSAIPLLYSCEICNMEFPKQKGLYYHLKSRHPDWKN